MRAPGRRFPLLPRKKRADKSAYGHVLIAAGSRRMAGAAVLAATGALRAGAGLVTLAAPRGMASALRKKLPPEIMLLPASETRRGSFAAGALRELLRYGSLRRINAAAVGPGLSSDPAALRFARDWVRRLPVAAVVDADGLNAFKGRVDELPKAAAARILTPHVREFQRLFGERISEDPAVRSSATRAAAKRSKAVVVLKGRGTVVSDGKRIFVNQTGNPGLAKGGSGDVLTGITAAFLAQGLGAFEAAAWAVYYHGKAADLAVRRTGELGLTASDVIAHLPKAFRSRL